MNKIEFEILNLIQSHPLGISGFDVINQFNQMGPIKIREILLTLHKNGFVKASTIVPDAASNYHITASGFSALLNHEESLEKENQVLRPFNEIAHELIKQTSFAERQLTLAESAAKKAEQEARAAKRYKNITLAVSIIGIVISAALSIIGILY